MKTIFILIAICLLCNIIIAQSGTLDTSYGNYGKILSENYEGNAYANILQQDGKLVVGGGGTYYQNEKLLKGTLLARYNTDGTPDYNFADSGRGLYILGDTATYIPIIHAMALQPDGKIVALGDFGQQNGYFGPLSLMRFNSDGTADKGFGINGLTITQITGVSDRIKDLALLSDGRIVVVGNTNKDIHDYGHYFIACYTSEGKLDKNFGDTGVVVHGDGMASVSAVTVTANDKIILAGGYGYGAQNAVFSYNNNGTPDSSFGNNGIGQIFFDKSVPGATVNDVKIDKNGNIITAGWVTALRMSVCRFLSNGTPDKSFGNNGYNYTLYDSGFSYGNAISIQQDNKIVIAGYSSLDGVGEFLVSRYLSTGFTDSSFGINGFQNTLFYGDDIANCVNIQNDGKIILVGTSNLDGQFKSFVAIARYNNDLSKKQLIITKIKKWIQHHNGIEWDNINGVSSYVVQRSYDGIHFNSIARINAGRQSNFTYADPMPLSGNNYYRLQTTSISGAVTNSNVVAVTADDDAIKISPNPAKSSLHIQGLSNQKVQLSVVDFSGNIKFQTIVNSSTYNLNVASLKSGNYLLKIESQDDVVTKSFVKE